MSDSDEDKRGPLDVTFRDFTPANEAELRLLNSVIFPIRYSVSNPSPLSSLLVSPSYERRCRTSKINNTSPRPPHNRTSFT